MARMLANPATLTRSSPVFSRFFSSTCRPIWGYVQPTRIPVKTLQITGFKACSSSSSYLHPFNFGYRAGFKNLSCSNAGFGQLGFDRFRVLAASGGGSGKAGGIGGFGDGNSGSGGGAGDGGAGGNKWSFISWYMAMLAKFPVLTKAITSALLTLMGDVICQLVIEQVTSVDLKRTFVFTFLGLVLVGPTLHFWYLYLSKLVTMPGASGAFSRLVLDQFLFSPLFIGFFLSTLVTLEGRPAEVVPRLEQEWLSSVLANWKLWIPFQFLNFLFVPQQFQVLGANFIAIIWNVILSFKAHKEVLPK